VKLEEGSFRFDANVSVRPEGAEALGTKVEIKNMNSFRSLERAVAYEIERQVSELESGGGIVQETRHWDEDAGVTHGMRTKEGSSDYRYFTEPDLVPIEIDERWRDEIRRTLPELPAERRSRYEDAGLEPGLAAILASAPAEIRAAHDTAVDAGADPRSAATWMTGEVTAWLRRHDTVIDATPFTGAHLAELLGMISDGTVSASAAKDVLDGVLSGEGRPSEVAETRDLLQMTDTGALEQAVDAVLSEHPDAAERFQGGEEKVVGFLVGQVMRATQGKADPRAVNELIRDRLS
jgi:aspartyl-tRNA(Asn)/glutamyl-tRNA(Gln) amidotransferase subunit B